MALIGRDPPSFLPFSFFTPASNSLISLPLSIFSYLSFYSLCGADEVSGKLVVAAHCHCYSWWWSDMLCELRTLVRFFDYTHLLWWVGTEWVCLGMLLQCGKCSSNCYAEEVSMDPTVYNCNHNAASYESCMASAGPAVSSLSWCYCLFWAVQRCSWCMSSHTHIHSLFEF